MKMTNSEIVALYTGLTNIINKEEKYPVKFSFAVAKNRKMLERFNSDFEEARMRLLDEYNVKDEDGRPLYKETGLIEIAEGCREDWEKAIMELVDIEVDVPPMHTVSISVLEGMEIEPDVLYICQSILTD